MFKDVLSQKYKVKYGTPQGSVLGPLLYILLTNDMPKVLKFCKCIMFADDTTICLSGNNLNLALRKVNEDLQHLMKWFNINSLSLNIEKSCYIIFNNSRKGDFNWKIKADDKEIKRVSDTKFLGVYIDEFLNWNKHVHHLSMKVSSGIYSLNMGKNMIPNRLEEINVLFKHSKSSELRIKCLGSTDITK